MIYAQLVIIALYVVMLAVGIMLVRKVKRLIATIETVAVVLAVTAPNRTAVTPARPGEMEAA